jgi:hypothetical protein
MQASRVEVKPWCKTCSRCGKATFEDLLDENGLCDYCREVAAIKVASKKRRQTPKR